MTETFPFFPKEVTEALLVLFDFVETQEKWADSDPDWDAQDWKMRRVNFMDEHLEAFVQAYAELRGSQPSAD
jgi:hypothetical protein